MATATLAAANPFKKATRAKSRLRMALCGPAGSGKSYSALRFAFALKKLLEESQQREIKVATIDTENGTLSKYVGEVEDGIAWDFDNINLQDFSPSSYTQLIKMAESYHYDITVIDSLSHAWAGTGGALEQVDKKKAAEKNQFAGWREITPMHNAMVDAIVASNSHIIATMRVKTEWVMEVDARTGKTVPKKIGMAPVQRAGVEYEFDIVGDIDQETHTLTVTKSRCKAIDNAIITKPGFNFFVPIFTWLESGSDIPREVLDAAAFKTKEPPMSALERAKKQKEEAEKKKATPKPAKQAAEQSSEAASEPVTSGGEASNDDAPPVISDKTRGDIRALVVEIWPERADSVRESKAIVERYGVTAVSELSESDGQKIVAELLGIKSEVMRQRAAEKLAASGTDPSIVAEPDKAQRKAAEAASDATAESAQGSTAPPDAAPSLTQADETTPDADDANESADLSNEPGTATKQQLKRCADLAESLNWSYEKQTEYLGTIGCQTFRNLSEAQIADLIGKLEKKLAKASKS